MERKFLLYLGILNQRVKMALKNSIEKMKNLYNTAKDTKVGDTFKCPTCNKKTTKNTYQKTFCSNGKTKGKGNCKDGFWNIVDPEKRCRNTPYFRNVIKPKIDALEEMSNEDYYYATTHPFSSEALGQE